MTRELSCRRPTTADYPAILALFAEHGWKTDVRLLSSLLAPANAVPLCGCLGERVVGFFLATRWGQMAWTGYLIVARELRGRGIGNALKQRLIADLQAEGVVTFRNISAEGLHRFQARQQFEVERKIVLLSRTASGNAGPSLPSPPLAALATYDRARFGADRSHRLRAHLERGHPCAVLTGGSDALCGYALAWPLGAGYRIGPIVTEPDADLTALLGPLLDALPTPSPASVCLYADDPASLEAVTRLGFAPYGEAFQFIWGPGRTPQDERVKSVWGRATG